MSRQHYKKVSTRPTISYCNSTSRCRNFERPQSSSSKSSDIFLGSVHASCFGVLDSMIGKLVFTGIAVTEIPLSMRFLAIKSKSAALFLMVWCLFGFLISYHLEKQYVSYSQALLWEEMNMLSSGWWGYCQCSAHLYCS